MSTLYSIAPHNVLMVQLSNMGITQAMYDGASLTEKAELCRAAAGCMMAASDAQRMPLMLQQLAQSTFNSQVIREWYELGINTARGGKPEDVPVGGKPLPPAQ